MDPRRTEVEQAEHDRSRRNEFYDRGVIAKGDKRINPAMKRTAYEFDQWRHTQPSHHIDEGAFLNNLEREERLTGKWSYPEGHPRRVAYESGSTPEYEETKHIPGMYGESPEAPSRAQEPSAPRVTPMRPSAAPPAPKMIAPVRTNRYAASCTSCGQSVGVGEGKLERTSSGWSTTHYPKCP